jgi:hypothetical protein
MPHSFASENLAIAWAHHTGGIRNLQVICTDRISNLGDTSCRSDRAFPSVQSARISTPPRLERSPDGDGFRWRCDLLRSRGVWRDWFQGLGALFLAQPVPKLLIVSGAQNLDTEMLVAQMQGKFETKYVYWLRLL